MRLVLGSFVGSINMILLLLEGFAVWVLVFDSGGTSLILLPRMVNLGKIFFLLNIRGTDTSEWKQEA